MIQKIVQKTYGVQCKSNMYALKVLEEEKENMVRKKFKQLNIKSKNQ